MDQRFKWLETIGRYPNIEITLDHRDHEQLVVKLLQHLDDNNEPMEFYVGIDPNELLAHQVAQLQITDWGNLVETLMFARSDDDVDRFLGLDRGWLYQNVKPPIQYLDGWDEIVMNTNPSLLKDDFKLYLAQYEALVNHFGI